MDIFHEQVVAATRRWISAVVIGLDLCPFAQRAFQGELIRYVVSDATDAEELRTHLAAELDLLQAASPKAIETTFVIHPHALARFTDFCDFLPFADSLVRTKGYRGVFQIASFHPQFQFADSRPDAVENYVNRSPYPMLHLLREASVSAAVASNVAADRDVPKRNIATMRSLGLAAIRSMVRNSEVTPLRDGTASPSPPAPPR